ncbi:hypothetical protein JYT97_03770 [Haliea sp. AH-315-K21]|uniref:Copper-binding protein n=1 Tax=SAR86 cluster bacterium TaxID=2030880 RepID=A0A2A5CGC4_9GAMM|nr:hypothetical protein [Haliea sp. AH-315-K21]PCJ42909.1 MAG: hypothetical protein COA71_05285 [SAR86 cluster bacterium]
MKKNFKIFSITLLVFLATFQAKAHHGYPQYNLGGEGMALHGKIVTYRISNPHSYMTLIVVDDAGEEEVWAIETTDTARGMRTKGFTPTTLQAGDEVTMMVAPALNGDRTAVFRSVELADGTILPASGQ